MNLADLNTAMQGCTACRLAETRTRVVAGSGPSNARLFLLGEAPGASEDRQGEPFVGRSGRLLDELLGEVGLDRDRVFVTNVVKCRPPDNRNPRADEIGACRGHLESQLRLIEPRVVVTLGNFAAQWVLSTRDGITRLRGRSYPWEGRTVVPTFHPAAALRGGTTVKDALRADLATARKLSEQA